jgi:uncharacterized membrane protein
MTKSSDRQVKLSILDLLVSHHPVHQLDRCYRVNAKGRSLFICARCLGLYPVLALTLAVSLSVGPGWEVSPWVMAILCVPALSDWGIARIGLADGANSIRTATGALAGLGLGLSLPGYFRNPSNPRFWYALGSLAAAALLTEATARFVKMRD